MGNREFTVLNHDVNRIFKMGIYIKWEYALTHDGNRNYAMRIQSNPRWE